MRKGLRTLCDVCGKKIYFKRNTEGKNVPFTEKTGICHFSECNLKPRIDTPPKIKVYSSTWLKPKVSYATIRANKKLDEFIPIDE